MADARKIRRIGVLCLYCIGNIASYRAGWTNKKVFRVNTDFWRKVNGNFLDIATLDWCKIFVEHDGKHHWSTIFPDKKSFRADLFSGINVSEKDFRNEIKEIKKYRDKFLAHLDEPTALYYPKSEIMLKSSMFLYHLLATSPKTRMALSGALIDPQDFYDDYYQVAMREISNAEAMHQKANNLSAKKSASKKVIAKRTSK
jgi:hypothetical protein